MPCYKLFSWCFFLIVLAGMFLFIPPASPQEMVTLGIAPLVDRTGDHSQWGYFLRDTLHASIERTNLVTLADSLQVDDVIRDARLPRDRIFVHSTAQVLMQRIGCDFLIAGSFRLREIAGVERFVVNLRIYQAGKDGYVEIESEVFDRKDAGRIGGYYTKDVLEIMGFLLPSDYVAPDFDPDPLEPLYLSLLKRDEALATYGEGQFPDRPLWQEAFRLAQDTIDQKPDYLMGYAYLADMYRKTGWMAKEVEIWNNLLERLGQAERAEWTSLAAGRAYLRLAHAYEYQGKSDLALQSLEAALRVDPGLAGGYFLMGKIYFDRGETAKAQDFWDEAYRLDPSLKEARYFAEVAERATIYGREAFEAYRTGYTFYSAGDLTAAEGHFRMAARLNPEMKEAQYWLGRTLYDMGKLDESIEAWRRVVELDPFDSQARRFLDRSIQEKQYGREAMNQFRRGFDLYQEGQFQEAIGYFRQATALSPVFPEAHDFLARSYFMLGETEQYIRERDTGIALIQNAQERGWQYYQVGFELFSWEQPEQAIEFLQRAVREDPALADAHLLLAELLAERNRWAEASHHYSQARQLTLDHEEKGLALWGEIVTLVQMERWDDALPLLEEVVKEYPFANYIEEAEALRIELLVKAGKGRDSRVAFQQFLMRFPQSTLMEKLRFFYGLSFYQDREYPEAIQSLEYVIDQYPGSTFLPEIHEMLGFAYRSIGEEEKAQQFFSRLDGEQGIFLSADASYRKQEWQRSVDGFQGYLTRYPQGRYQSEARLKLASSYLELNDAVQAAGAIQGWENEIRHDFPLDYAQLQIKLRFKLEQWQEVVEAVIQLRNLGGELDTEYLLLEALAYDNLGDREHSVAILTALGYNPDEVLVDEESELVQEAVDLVTSGNLQAAARLSQILGENLSTENRSMVQFLYGKVLYQQGNLASAKEPLQQSLVAGNRDLREETLFYLGDIAYQAGDWNEVIEAYQPLVSLNQGAILWRLAQAYRNMGRQSEARNLLEDLKDNPEYAQRVYEVLMDDAYQEGRYGDFLEYVGHFMTRFPDHQDMEEVLYMSVWSAYKLGDNGKSRELISEYLDRFGDTGKYRNELQSLLADLFIETGEFEAALPLLQELDQAGDTVRSDSARLRMGTIYLSQEQFDRAAFYFERLVSDPSGQYYTRAGYLLGACLEYLERTDDAIVFYRRMVESGREDEWVVRSRERLNLLTTQ